MRSISRIHSGARIALASAITVGSLLLAGCGGGGGGGGNNANAASADVTRFSVDKESIDFGSAVVDQNVPGSMTVTNTGTTTLNVQASLSGDAVFGSLEVPAGCSSLAADATCVINVSFAPDAEGDYSGTVSLSASGAAGRSVALTGSGQELNVQITRVDQSCIDPLTATISVTNATSQPVGGLLGTDFSAFLSDSANAGNLISATEVPVRKPFALMLAVDWSGSTENIRDAIIDATDSFIDALQPDDKVGLLRFAREIEQSGIDRGLILANAVGKSELQAALRADFTLGTAASDIWDAVQQSRRIVDDESEATYTRVVILLSDGVDTGSQDPLDDVASRAQAANTLVYTVGFEGTSGFNLEDLRQLSDETGALAFQSTDANDLQQFYTSIAESLTGLYELAIENPNGATSLRVAVDTGAQTGADSRPVSACPP